MQIPIQLSMQSQRPSSGVSYEAHPSPSDRSITCPWLTYNAGLWLSNRLWADETGVCHCGTITVLSLVVITTTKSWLVAVGLPRILRGSRSHHITADGLQTSLLHLNHPLTSERTQKTSLRNTRMWTESVRTATEDWMLDRTLPAGSVPF